MKSFAFVHRWPALWCAVLLLALVVRLSAATWWEQRLDMPFGFGDSESYWHLARAIAHGEPYEFGSADAKIFRTPGYPLALSVVFLIAGDTATPYCARAFGAALGTAAVGGIGCLAYLLFDRSAALLASLVAAIYPGAVALSVFVLSETLFCPLVIAQLALWHLTCRADFLRYRVGYSLACGIVAGAATLTRPGWLLFTPLAAFLGLAFNSPRLRHFQNAALMLIAMCVVLAPWWWRNACVTGRFVPTSLQVGASWYDAWSPAATGASDLRPAERRAAELRRATIPPGVNREYEIDRSLRQEAWQWARQHPHRVGELAVVKFCRMWSPWPNEAAFRGIWIGTTVATSYTLVLATALAGLWRFRHLGWPVALLWLPAVYLSLVHAVFVGSIRYREPAMLPLIVLGAAWFVDRCRTSGA